MRIFGIDVGVKKNRGQYLYLLELFRESGESVTEIVLNTEKMETVKRELNRCIFEKRGLFANVKCMQRKGRVFLVRI